MDQILFQIVWMKQLGSSFDILDIAEDEEGEKQAAAEHAPDEESEVSRQSGYSQEQVSAALHPKKRWRKNLKEI